MGGYAAVILAGGVGRRMAAGHPAGPAEVMLPVGGRPVEATLPVAHRPIKPMLPVGGRPMIVRVLDAVADADFRLVVGPPELDLPAGVGRVLEQPPGGGPVAAVAAGLAAMDRHDPATSGRISVVALFAADLPLLTRAAVARLLTTLAASDGAHGAVFVDGRGRRQTLCGVWRRDALLARCARVVSPAGTPMRVLLRGLRVGEVSAREGEPPPWYDCDVPADLRRAERWM